MKIFSGAVMFCIFTGSLALAMSLLDVMSFFEQAFILWVCLPIAMGSILAYFMNKTHDRQLSRRPGYMSNEWTLINFK